MAITLTDEQRQAVEDDLVSQAIVACAGSGKTISAVRRVAEIRRRMPRRGYVALLSYSNVAVDTFRSEYLELTKNRPELSDRVVIATVDSFTSTNILLPHGPRSMKCDCRPFLVTGGEGWLNGFKFHNGTYPVSVKDLAVSVDGAGFAFADVSSRGAPQPVARDAVEPVIERLGKTGAYTHALARYWTLRSLVEQERLVEILARRYPFILIDEAQDIGSMHGVLVTSLIQSGVNVSVIGDPDQAIYEFADADGSYLREFGGNPGVSAHSFTENRRSVSQIVSVASALSSRPGKAIREPPTRKHGAYFIPYKAGQIGKLVDTFKAILSGHAYPEGKAAILCRATTWVESILGGATEIGRGATERLAEAAIFRERGEIAKAFECVVDGVLRLMEAPPERLRRDIQGADPRPEVKVLRRLLWEFLKRSDTGLPAGVLRAKSEWHPRLKSRLPDLLGKIESAALLKRAATWKHNLTTADLGDNPLVERDLLSDGKMAIRARTVHKVKGEGIDAVLYIARKDDLDKMLAGTGTEVGRIGYVAVTRARDLLILGIPANTPNSVIVELKSKGFSEWS